MSAVRALEGLDLEGQFRAWRAFMERRRAVVVTDVDELEAHLRDLVTDLVADGLAEDEAFLVAVKRMGNLDAISREFAREHSERLWKQLVLTPDSRPSAARPEALVAFALGVGAAVAVQAPRLFGLTLDDAGDFYVRNLSLFVLPFLTAFFAWKRRVRPALLPILAAPFVLAAVLVNAYPFTASGSTAVLAALHLPIALWTVVGVAYVAGDVRSGKRRMDFVRFTGEWVIYYALLALGGAVFSVLTVAAFGAIGIDVGPFVENWILPSGGMGAVVIAAWLVEAKQSVIENMAPVLTKVFTPLVTVMLLAFLVALAWTRSGVDIERDLLIVFDLLLILVLGLLLYTISARDHASPPGWFDRLQLVLVVSALAIDLVVLGAMLSRTSEYGFSANKTASLGLNLILVANLAWSAWLSAGYLRGRRPYGALERWQAAYLPVYGAWAAVVVVAFPPLFGFV